MNTKHLDLYTDYLAVIFGYTTATGLSDMLDGSISHDKITRFLADGEWISKYLWKQVKSTGRKVEADDGVLIFGDTVQEKPWMDENDLICRHYDHCKERSIKGINMLNCLSYRQYFDPRSVRSCPQADSLQRPQNRTGERSERSHEE